MESYLHKRVKGGGVLKFAGGLMDVVFGEAFMKGGIGGLGIIA